MGNNPFIDDPNSVHFETRRAVIVAKNELQKTSLKDEFNFIITEKVVATVLQFRNLHCVVITQLILVTILAFL